MTTLYEALQARLQQLKTMKQTEHVKKTIKHIERALEYQEASRNATGVSNQSSGNTIRT